MKSFAYPVSTLTRTIGVLMVCCGLTSISTAVLAADSPSTQQVLVSFRDLNLDNEAEAQDLIDRLNRAATDLCESGPVRGPVQSYYSGTRKLKACRNEAVKNAVAKVSQPVVTRVYEKNRDIDHRIAKR